MEPKNTVQAQVGSGFSITINMGSDAPKVVKTAPKPEKVAEITDLEPKKEANEQPKLHTTGKRKTIPKK